MSQPMYVYGDGGNQRAEISIASIKPFSASIKFTRATVRDYPDFGFHPFSDVPASLVKQTCKAIAGICRENGEGMEAKRWDARARLAGLEHTLTHLLDGGHTHGRSR